MNQQEKEKERWSAIKDDMARQGGVGAYGFDAYISKLTLKKDTGTKLIFEYPADLLIMWVEANYLPYMKNSAARVLDGAREIEFVAEGEVEAAETKATEQISTVKAAKAQPSSGREKPKATNPRRTINSGLNEAYTFENFVVGSNSEFAYAAANAAASGNDGFYNPLFIYGESGLGKTHLLQAIGNAIRSRRENTQVLYVTSEDFTNMYIDALSHKGDALNSFRRKYRRADVLLIDDVQFLASKDKTQEEFFHTFNALFAAGKQIILSSDRPASEITLLDKRLSSRFEQGLSVAILPPCYETRLAILRSKRRSWKSTLIGDDVLDFIARNITKSVRRMEGALVRLASLASFSHHSPTVTEARFQLRDLLRDEHAVTGVSIETIQQRVADEFNLRLSDLNGRRRTANVAHPRQIAMYLARKFTQLSLQDIGAAFGGRDHGTVIHAAKTIEQKLESDPDLRAVINRMTAEVCPA